MSYAREQGPRPPPRGFVRLAWHVHRALYRVTGRGGRDLEAVCRRMTASDLIKEQS